MKYFSQDVLLQALLCDHTSLWIYAAKEFADKFPVSYIIGSLKYGSCEISASQGWTSF